MAEQSPNAVEVTYKLGDLYAVTFQAWWSHVLKILLLPAVVLILLLFLAAIGGSNPIQSVMSFPWEFILGLMALLLLLRMGIAPTAGYLDARRTRDLGPIRFELSDEGIGIDARNGRSLIYWTAVKRVKATKRRLFLFTGRATALIIPRRAFSNRATFESTVGRARARWNTANP